MRNPLMLSGAAPNIPPIRCRRRTVTINDDRCRADRHPGDTIAVVVIATLAVVFCSCSRRGAEGAALDDNAPDVYRHGRRFHRRRCIFSRHPIRAAEHVIVNRT
jgi:hypothetical protein